MTDARIALLGEALVDVLPDAEVAGGAPYNVARNLAALGADPLLVTRIGADAAGLGIEQGLRRLGMRIGGVQCDDARRTGRVQVRLTDGEARFEIGRDAAWDHIDADAATRAVAAFAPSLVYFGTLAQRSPASREAIRAVASIAVARRMVDLNLRGIDDECDVAAASLEIADVVKANDKELDALLEWFVAPSVRERGLDASVPALLRQFGIERLVVTRGANGWACFGRNGELLRGRPGPAIVVRDTVGAGDAFSAVMLLGEARAWPLATTLARAAMFAGQVCTLRGAFEAASPIYAAARASWEGVIVAARG